MELVDPKQTTSVQYDDLCVDPATQIERIGTMFQRNDLDVSRAGDAPQPFDRSRGKPLPDGMEDELRAALQRLYA